MTMNGKQKLLGLLQGRRADELAWTAIADDVTFSAMPEEIKKLNPLEFYQYIGCDTLQFGNYGIEHLKSAVKYPYTLLYKNVETIYQTLADGVTVKKMVSPWGELEFKYLKGHPTKYPVATAEDLRVYRNICLDMQYILDQSGCEESYQNMETAIGDNGIFIPITQESPVQTLLEYIMGTETFYYLYYDHPNEMEELLEIMHDARKEEYSIIARHMPHQACIPVENTSTAYISPNFYKKFSVPQLRDYADILHAGGKKCILHMCGSIKDLLPDIKETNLDGIHTLTPGPIGNTDYELAFDVLGEQMLIIGCLDPSVFQRAHVTKEEIWRCLDSIYTPRLRKSNFILLAAADGLPTDISRFHYIREWMDKNGAIT